MTPSQRPKEDDGLKALGRQIILECYDCDPEIINDAQAVEQIMIDAALEAEATVIKSAFHPFFPQGVSGVVVIAESHLTIHTWPELGYAAVDVFTCGDQASPERACEYLLNKFRCNHHTTVEIKRGQMVPPHQRHEDEVVVPLQAGLRKNQYR